MVLNTLQDKVVVLTGGGGGIGRATALKCAELGATCIGLCDVSSEAMESVKEALTTKFPSVKVLCTVADVSNAEQVDAWIEAVVKEFGKLDGCANIAGLSKRQPDTNTSNIRDDDWATTVAVNLTGTMHCMRAQLKHITRPGGSIVNISSGAGMKGIAGMPSYSATKWGQRGLTKSAASEFGPEGVRINTLMPGLVHSGPAFDRAVAAGLVDPVQLTKNIPMRRMGKTEEIGNVIAFLLSEDASYITGIDIAVDGGTTGV